MDSFGYRSDGLVRSLSFRVPCAKSMLNVSVSLDVASEFLDFHVTTDWKESGEPAAVTPSLLFTVCAPEGSEYLYDVPYGLLRRDPVRQDRPAKEGLPPGGRDRSARWGALSDRRCKG